MINYNHRNDDYEHPNGQDFFFLKENGQELHLIRNYRICFYMNHPFLDLCWILFLTFLASNLYLLFSIYRVRDGTNFIFFSCLI